MGSLSLVRAEVAWFGRMSLTSIHHFGTQFLYSINYPKRFFYPACT